MKLELLSGGGGKQGEGIVTKTRAQGGGGPFLSQKVVGEGGEEVQGRPCGSPLRFVTDFFVSIFVYRLKSQCYLRESTKN